MASRRCVWDWDEWADFYHTSCESDFCFSDDMGLKDKSFKFCPYCGKKIKEVRNDGEQSP